MKGKITISSKLNEQEFMESILNMHHSGINVELPLSLYALAKSWHIDKFIYYANLLEEKDV